jgi:hypothetical protein
VSRSRSVAGEEIIDQRSRQRGQARSNCSAFSPNDPALVILVGHKVMITLGPRIDHRKAHR